MTLVDRIKEKARADVKRIVLPEGDEQRTIKAAEAIRAEGLAEPILVTPETIAADKPRLERYMIRPVIYKAFTRCVLTLLVILLWDRYLQPRTPHITLNWAFTLAGAVFFLCAYLIRLRLDGLRIPRMKPLKRPRRDPYRAYGDMADYLDEPPVSFEDLDERERDVCSLLANMICGILSLAASFLSL